MPAVFRNSLCAKPIFQASLLIALNCAVFVSVKPVWSDQAEGAPIETTAPALTSGQTLDQLLTDYRAYGLPFPPDNAQLMFTRSDNGQDNGKPAYDYDVAFCEIQGKRRLVWMGCATVDSHLDADEIEVVSGTGAEVFNKIRNADSQFSSDGFGTYQYLALAIQCHARGLDQYVAALLERSRQPAERYQRNCMPQRPKEDRAAVAVMAWAFWCDEFARSSAASRRVAVNQLRQLLDGGFGLDTPSHRHIVQDMRLTLAVRNSPAGSLEEAVDSLVDLGIGDDFAAGDFASLDQAARGHDGYKKLRHAGLDAVPILVQHLGNFRMTRCIEQIKDYAYHVRVADVVAKLLNELVNEEFSYDLLIREGRGKRLDEAHVVDWWTGVGREQPLNYIREHAITIDSQGRLVVNSQMLRMLGERSPDDLIKCFERHLVKVQDSYPLYDVLGDSKVPLEIQGRLFLAAAENSDPLKRIFAIRHLLQLQHPQAPALLVKELDGLPNSPKVAYWLTETGRIAALACLTNDEQVWTAMARNAKRVDLGQRLELMEGVGRSKKLNEQAIRFFTLFLADTTVRERVEALKESLFSGPCAGFMFQKLAVRDFAALKLALQLNLPDDSQPSWSEEQWSVFRAEVEQALAERQSLKKQNGETP